jgi:hypothetical protein
MTEQIETPHVLTEHHHARLMGTTDRPPHICTKDQPWKPGFGKGVWHDDVDVYPTGEPWTERQVCRNCGCEMIVEFQRPKTGTEPAS